MINKKLKLMICLLSLFALAACNYDQAIYNYADLFSNEVYNTLNKSSKKSGDIPVEITTGLNGYLILAAPYSISEADPTTEIGGLINNKIVKIIQDDSACHLFIVKDKKILSYKKWTSSPISFNGYFYTILTNKYSVVFSLEDRVLKKLSSEEKKNRVDLEE